MRTGEKGWAGWRPWCEVSQDGKGQSGVRKVKQVLQAVDDPDILNKGSSNQTLEKDCGGTFNTFVLFLFSEELSLATLLLEVQHSATEMPGVSED